MTTEEGNKIIAEFMSEIVVNNKYVEVISGAFGTGTKTLYTIKYDCSWSWLMPVVEKIESIHDEHDGYYGVYISSNTCTIQGTNIHMAMNDLSGYGPVYMSDPNAVFNTKIESTWYNVIQFIQWYNSNKKTT